MDDLFPQLTDMLQMAGWTVTKPAQMYNRQIEATLPDGSESVFILCTVGSQVRFELKDDLTHPIIHTTDRPHEFVSAIQSIITMVAEDASDEAKLSEEVN